jgi:hypothetical protein
MQVMAIVASPRNHATIDLFTRGKSLTLVCARKSGDVGEQTLVGANIIDCVTGSWSKDDSKAADAGGASFLDNVDELLEEARGRRQQQQQKQRSPTPVRTHRLAGSYGYQKRA